MPGSVEPAENILADSLNVIENSESTLQYWFDQGLSAWQYYVHEISDKRTSDWPLMGSPIPTGVIISLWYIFVIRWGPNFMKNRKPYELKNVLIVYNFLQVCVSTVIVAESIELYTLKYSLLKCENIDRSTDIDAMRICRGFYIYYLAKVSELMDTVFFVLRKKHNQITFLHIYHHGGMPMLSWCCAKYFPGGHAAFIGFINSFVHIVMYFYYMLAAMGPRVQKYLWWKKWITILQLVQFAVAFVHFMQVLNADCNYPKWAVIIVFPNAFFLYYLFWDFYRKAYKSKMVPAVKDEGLDSKLSPLLESSEATGNVLTTDELVLRRRNPDTRVVDGN